MFGSFFFFASTRFLPLSELGTELRIWGFFCFGFLFFFKLFNDVKRIVDLLKLCENDICLSDCHLPPWSSCLIKRPNHSGWCFL